MDQLIKISTKGTTVVDARELHEFLGSNQHFTDWIKNRISSYGFVENEDYTSFHKSMKRGTVGATVRKEYAITMDMAKELCMIENNEKGKQARKYFIEAEKSLRTKQYAIKEPTRKELALMVIKAEEEIEKQNQVITSQGKTIKKQARKSEYVDKVLESHSTYTTTSIAKELGMSAQRLNFELRKHGILFIIDKHHVLYWKYHGKGYMDFKTIKFEDKEGKKRTGMQEKWTERGRAFIHSLFNKDLTLFDHTKELKNPAT